MEHRPPAAQPRTERELEVSVQRVGVHEIAVGPTDDARGPGRRTCHRHRLAGERARTRASAGAVRPPDPAVVGHVDRDERQARSGPRGLSGPPGGAASMTSMSRVGEQRCEPQDRLLRAPYGRAVRNVENAWALSQHAASVGSSSRRCLALVRVFGRRRVPANAIPPSSIPNNSAMRKFSKIDSTSPLLASATSAMPQPMANAPTTGSGFLRHARASRRPPTRPSREGRGTIRRCRRGSTRRAGCCATTPRVARAGTVGSTAIAGRGPSRTPGAPRSGRGSRSRGARGLRRRRSALRP